MNEAMMIQEVTVTTVHTEVREESCPILSALQSYFWSGENLPKGKDRLIPWDFLPVSDAWSPVEQRWMG